MSGDVAMQKCKRCGDIRPIIKVSDVCRFCLDEEAAARLAGSPSVTFYEQPLVKAGLETFAARTAASQVDAVNHPTHYQGEGGVESIDVIEGFNLGFNLGNAVKYILRAGVKDPKKHVEDCEKAEWYLKRALRNLVKHGHSDGARAAAKKTVRT